MLPKRKGKEEECIDGGFEERQGRQKKIKGGAWHKWRSDGMGDYDRRNADHIRGARGRYNTAH